VKRIVDLMLGGVLAILAAPMAITVAVAIRVADGAPVLFRQARSGRGGRPFDLIKFRTMRAAVTPEWDPTADVLRTTRLGAFLRSSSLDELPTLLNVLRGEMSLVGPRPLPVQYLSRYSDEQARRLEVRPGVTGWAQVNGRNALTWNDKFGLDVWYVDHHSLPLDFKILIRTIRQVLRREGIDHGVGTTMTEFRGPGS
jgi:lipopolysaccharide/colanic/teichoic acid biosynthesis glycosyltransferase